jgi:hypothetical protein
MLIVQSRGSVEFTWSRLIAKHSGSQDSPMMANHFTKRNNCVEQSGPGDAGIQRCSEKRRISQIRSHSWPVFRP